jgi:hypothetical protein
VFWQFAAALLLFAGGMFVGVRYQAKLRFHGIQPRIVVATHSLLSLNAERDGGQLRLTWDRNAAQIRAAGKASLYISDGGQQQALELSADELRGGEFAYTPTSDDVTMRLDLGGAANISESVRVIVARPSALSSPAPAPAAPAAALEPEVQPQPVKTAPVKETAAPAASAPQTVAQPAAVSQPPAASEPVANTAGEGSVPVTGTPAL